VPKQIIEINPFHGGMNNNTDPRDLQHDELASATDVMVDKIGRIRTGPSIINHASNTPSITIDNISDRSGTSLFSFSNDYKLADRVGTILQNGSSNMNSGSIWGGWSSSGTHWSANSSHFSFTGAGGGSDKIFQTAANRIDTGINLAFYKLSYTISNYNYTSGTAEIKILSGSDQFAADGNISGGQDEIFLQTSNGDHEIIFLSDDNAINNPFSIEANVAQYDFRLDNLKLELYELPSGQRLDDGDDYLILYLNTSASNYGFAIYSYANDVWSNTDNAPKFGTITTSANPVFSYVDGVLRIVDGLKGTHANKIWYSYIDRLRWGTTNVACRKWISCDSPIIAPTDSNIPIIGGGNNTNPSEGEFKIAVDNNFTRDIEESGNWNPNGVIGTSANSNNGLRKLVASDSIFLSSMVGLTIKQGSTTSIITGFESETIIYTESGTWSDNTAFKIYETYEIGFSWVYDGNQESLIHNRSSAINENKKNWSFQIDRIGCGYSWDTETTARKTGMHMYYRKKSDTTNTWYHMAEFDFNKGFRKSNEDDFSKTWIVRSNISEYQIVDINFDSPPLFETYESRNGYKNDVNSLLDFSDSNNDGMGYSASIIANRVHYIANVRYKDKDGLTRNHDDIMFKSVVNKFDTFPISRKIEVTVQDGDKITALASYADRVLQYKKNKMHLINISQEVEFLEDTFKFKGVESQAAVCETDFGIAWVNLFGCYLYDGRQVLNLLEQKGVRKISQDSWNHVNHNPMIAYLPKDRQLIIAKDHSGGDLAVGNGDAWIYDMVTKSWVIQEGEFIVEDGQSASNFITDHKGDIVYTIGTGTMKTLSTSSSSKINVKIVTADMNYGDSGVRKKVYRVRLSYKGDASSLNVRYTTNGDTDTFKQFEGTSSGLPNGSATNTPLENKSSDITQWHHAELKPAVSSESTNIYSFQVHMTGTAGATFEINDLSVVFRSKNIK
tara:strand:+ start:182 stop:3046 length:2865 start_codon:yes stop_codon:yes gene_type:complete